MNKEIMIQLFDVLNNQFFMSRFDDCEKTIIEMCRITNDMKLIKMINNFASIVKILKIYFENN